MYSSGGGDNPGGAKERGSDPLSTAASNNSSSNIPSSGSGVVPTDFFAMAALIEQLKSDDLALRIAATRELPAIATALGPDRVRAELIPFVIESTDDEDEVLLVAAEQLGNLTEFVGGEQHAHLLLEPLEALASVEESAVREKAAESIVQIFLKIPQQSVVDYCVPMVTRMGGKDWFTARISACGLIGPIYGLLDDSEHGVVQEELRQLFARLCRDDTPMVRRVAAASLGRLAREVALGARAEGGSSGGGVVNSSIIVESLLPLFLELSGDGQDSVRLQTVDNCIALAEALSDDPILRSTVLPVVLSNSADSSWRVRWSMASKYDEIGSSYFPGGMDEQVAGCYESLLQDSEAEVRTAAAFNVTKVSEIMGSDATVSKIIPRLQHLVLDQSEYVRAALASVICDMSSVLGKDDTIQYLLPLLLNLLRDTSSEVRLNIIARFQCINEVIGIELLSQSLLPAIMDLAEDAKWRVRLAIIDHIPLLAEQLGEVFFDEKLCDLCMSWMGDLVHAVRIAAANNIRKLTQLFGGDWVQLHMLPKVKQMRMHCTFLNRMTALYAVQMLTDCLEPELLESDILPIVLDMATDPVPNIRFNVSKALAEIAPRLSGSVVTSTIKPILSNLMQDGDRDVRFFTKKAIAAIG